MLRTNQVQRRQCNVRQANLWGLYSKGKSKASQLEAERGVRIEQTNQSCMQTRCSRWQAKPTPTLRVGLAASGDPTGPCQAKVREPVSIRVAVHALTLNLVG